MPFSQHGGGSPECNIQCDAMRCFPCPQSLQMPQADLTFPWPQSLQMAQADLVFPRPQPLQMPQPDLTFPWPQSLQMSKTWAFHGCGTLDLCGHVFQRPSARTGADWTLAEG